MKLPRVSARDWMALTPMNITAAMPAAVISATSNPYPPSEKTSRSRARIPSLDLCTKRFSSRFSWPNAFTTRAAPKTSCTTASAELSIFLTSRDATHPAAIGPRYQKNGRRNRQCHDCQLPIDPRRHVDHRQESDSRGDKRDDSLDDNVLNGSRVVLNPVSRICRAFAVVVGK